MQPDGILDRDERDSEFDGRGRSMVEPRRQSSKWRCTMTIRRAFLTSLCLTLMSTNCGKPVRTAEPSADRSQEILAMWKTWQPLGVDEASPFKLENDQIYCGDSECSAPFMKGVDIGTFEVCFRTRYARDKNRVYYPIEEQCEDGLTCSACYCTHYVVKGADPGSLRCLGNDYAADRRRGYLRGEEVENSDGPSFRVIDCPPVLSFAADSRNVYRAGRVFPDADPATFHCDRGDPRTNAKELVYIVGDKDREWKIGPNREFTEVPKK